MNSFGRKNSDEKESSRNSIFTKETIGMVLILFATLTLVCLITRDLVFSTPGKAINSFLLGVFGYSAYVYVVGLVVFGIYLVVGKKPLKKGAGFYLTILFFAVALLLAHAISTRKIELTTYGAYLKECYLMGEGGIKTSSFGGAASGVIVYLLVATIGFAGTYAVLGVILAALTYFIIRGIFGKKISVKAKPKEMKLTSVESVPLEVKEYPISGAVEEVDDKSRLFFREDDFELKSKREKQEANKKAESFKILYPNSKSNNSGLSYGEPITNNTYSDIYSEEMKKKMDYIKKPTEIKINKDEENWKTQSISRAIKKPKEEIEQSAELPPMYSHEEGEVTETDKRAQDFNKYAEIEEPEIDFTAPKQAVEKNVKSEIALEEDNLDDTKIPPLAERRRGRGGLFSEQPQETEITPTIPIIESEEKPIVERAPKTAEEIKTIPINRTYYAPPISLFKIYKQDINAPKENHEERSAIIERTLAEFGIDTKVVNYVQGPTVTRYEILMPAGVSVKKIPVHGDDIAMRLEADNVRIEAPIPGKNLVGIEVPNKVKTIVGLRDIIESEVFTKQKTGTLTFAVGKDIVGNCICDNVAKAPHYLVAGATGMGKSVCLNAMIISLITKYSPEELRLILIDPKQVEFSVYNHLPHLMVDEIITSAPKAIATLQWAIDEMERRYAAFKLGEVRDINEYNEIISSDTVPKMPKVVIIVDEVSDLMLYNKRDLETKIVALSQKARSAGLHLVLATQRPSTDVITGLIKANLPSRIAFRVNNFTDSGVILSESGAEKLLGNGDMLFKNSTMGKCERFQGAFIDTPEVKSIVSYIKDNNQAYFNDDAASEIEKAMNPPAPAATEDTSEGDEEEDKLFIDALRHVIASGSASISMMQRRFGLGYAKAGGLIDKMDRKGFISPFDGSRARQVLITKEQFEEQYGEL